MSTDCALRDYGLVAWASQEMPRLPLKFANGIPNDPDTNAVDDGVKLRVMVQEF